MSKNKQKTITMGRLFEKISFALTAEKAIEIFNRLGGDADAMQKELLPILVPHRTALEKAGFVPEWLTYAIPFHLGQAALADAQQQAAKTTARILGHHQNPWAGN